MKKLLSICLVSIITLMMTGCQTKGFANYQDAVRLTDSIKKGQVKVDVNIKVEFNKTGLTIDEEKALAPYEEMTTKVSSKYDEDDKFNMKTDIYYLIGAIGIDMSVMAIDNEFYLRIPFINSYMALEEASYIGNKPDKRLDITSDQSADKSKDETADQSADQETDETADEVTDQVTDGRTDEEATETGTLKDGESHEELTIDFNAIWKQWLKVLSEENVVAGENTYIITDEGQIKTTTYSFSLNEDQLNELMKALLDGEHVDAINKLIAETIYSHKASDDKDKEIRIEDQLKQFKLKELEGQAYVDFDNRLIRQEFVLKGLGTNPIPGNVESFEIVVKMDYMNLGEDQTFDFPTIDENNLVTQEDLERIFKSLGDLKF